MALTDENNGGGIPATMLVGPASLGNNAVPYYPVYNGGNNGNGNGMWGGDGSWIILLIIVLLAAGGGWGNGLGNNGNNGGFAGTPVVINEGANNNAYVQRGFDQAAIMGGLSGIQSGISNLSTQLCGCCGDMQNTMNQGFNGVQQSLCAGFAGVNSAVVGAQNYLAQQMYANQIADMERSYAAQTANTQGFNAMQAQLAQASCDNRAATADLKYTVATENCADRTQSLMNTRDIIQAITSGVQSIKDDLCNDRLAASQRETEAERRENANLRSQLNMANLAASTAAQNAFISQGFANEVDQLYNRLNNCPVPSTPVYGRQPIFTCGGQNQGCGCGSM